MNFLLLSILFISVNFISNFELEEDFELKDGSLCAGKIATSEFVLNFCANFGGTIKHRCCRSYDNETFVAVDLMDANLTEIPDFSEHENLNLSVIDFRSNDHLVSFNDSDFLTLINLNELILPDTIGECPGGERVWEIIRNITGNITDPSGLLCQNQKSICSNLTDLCVEQNSLCSPNGPNHFLCLCKTGYHGYKCLRYGQFPSALFFGLTAGVTIAASIFLYLTQRRHVKK